jgi:putative redox protein
MVEINIVYEGALRCSATHGPSGRSQVTDAPVDNQGKGESFSPTDLVGTALGTCMLTIMGIVAERNGWDLAGTQVVVEKHMVADPVRRIAKLVVRFLGSSALDERARTTLEEAARTCPVEASLGDKIEREFQFSWTL